MSSVGKYLAFGLVFVPASISVFMGSCILFSKHLAPWFSNLPFWPAIGMTFFFVFLIYLSWLFWAAGSK